MKNDSRYSQTRFTLLHSSRRPIELPPTEILAPLLSCAQKSPERLTVSLFVDSLEGPQHPSITSAALRVGKISRDAVERAVGSTRNSSWWQSLLRTGFRSENLPRDGKRILFLVCGPDPMISAIAGPFGRNFSQGEVGGVLAAMGYEREQVWKL